MDVAKSTWFTYIHKYNDKFTCIDLSQILSKRYLAELDFNFKDEYRNTIEITRVLPIDSDIDIDSIMDRLQDVKKLRLDYEVSEITSGNARYIISRPPKTLTELIIYRSNIIITNLETTNITKYAFDTFDKWTLCAYIPTLPNTVKTIDIKAKSIDETFYKLPSSVDKIILNLIHMNLPIDSWPINLQQLYLYIAYLSVNKNTGEKKSPYIGMLPHTLQIIHFHCPKYDYYLDLPPNLIELAFYTQIKYVHSIDFPDTIEKLHLYNYTYPHVKFLPKNCKTFIYSRCDDIIKAELQERYPNVIVTDTRSIADSQTNP
jgi:hypothetical protein